MNIVFFGSSKFAIPSLRLLLLSQHKISCVVTQPDRHRGRGLLMAETTVKKVAQGAGLKIYQPENINNPESLKQLKDFNPDLCVVVAYGQLLSEEVLAIANIFSVNLHASLLPKYRGAAPINWTIINGETSGGVTVMKMVRQMDAGPIIAQRQTQISPEDTAISLEEKLSKLGADLLLSCLKAIEDGKYQLIPQDEKKVSFAPKLKKEDGLISWDAPALNIYNLVRGCFSWPGAFTYYKGKLLKIYRARVDRQSVSAGYSKPGQIAEISKEGISVVTGKDRLLITELQLEARRVMTAQEFILGQRIKPADTLGK